LSCDSDAPQVGSARSDWTSVVKVNRLKRNRRKTIPYCISFPLRVPLTGQWHVKWTGSVKVARSGSNRCLLLKSGVISLTDNEWECCCLITESYLEQLIRHTNEQTQLPPIDFSLASDNDSLYLICYKRLCFFMAVFTVLNIWSGLCYMIYSDTSANEDNSFRNHIRKPKSSLAET